MALRFTLPVKAFVSCDLNEPPGQCLRFAKTGQFSQQIDTNRLKNVSRIFFRKSVWEWKRSGSCI